jgi:hypothetical protein
MNNNEQKKQRGCRNDCEIDLRGTNKSLFFLFLFHLRQHLRTNLYSSTSPCKKHNESKPYKMKKILSHEDE